MHLLSLYLIDRNCPCFLALESEKSLKNFGKNRGVEHPPWRGLSPFCEVRWKLPGTVPTFSESARKNGTVPFSQAVSKQKWDCPPLPGAVPRPGEPAGTVPFATPCEQKGTVPLAAAGYRLRSSTAAHRPTAPVAKKTFKLPLPPIEPLFFPPFKWAQSRQFLPNREGGTMETRWDQLPVRCGRRALSGCHDAVRVVSRFATAALLLVLGPLLALSAGCSGRAGADQSSPTAGPMVGPTATTPATPEIDSGTFNSAEPQIKILTANETTGELPVQRIDLGSVRQGELYHCTIIIENGTPSPVTIDRIDSSCNCSSFTNLPRSIPAARSTSLEVVVDERHERFFTGNLGILVRMYAGADLTAKAELLVQVAPSVQVDRSRASRSMVSTRQAAVVSRARSADVPPADQTNHSNKTGSLSITIGGVL